MTVHNFRRRSSRRLLAAALAAACLGAPGRAAAQQATPSLAEMARQEVERRKAIKVPGKVYTDKGARPAGGAAVAAGAAVATGTAQPPTPTLPMTSTAVSSETPAETPKAEADSRGEAYWRGRINEAREDLRRNETFAEALQSRVNGLTTDFASRDDPYQRAKIGDDRQKALTEQARVTAEIEAARKNIAAIEEEARQAGAPPGWLR
jgi:hypothetical protein